jgi:hypothetical protein
MTTMQRPIRTNEDNGKQTTPPYELTPDWGKRFKEDESCEKFNLSPLPGYICPLNNGRNAFYQR